MIYIFYLLLLYSRKIDFIIFCQSVRNCSMVEKEQGTRRLEIQHFSHKEHPLRFVYSSSYTCDGCGEAGYGFRYQCSLCNFDLHESCARAPKSKRHSCHPQHLLKFREKPFSPNIVCDVCREKISGFSYECRGCDIDVHPSCAKLPLSLQHPLHPHHKLQLVPCNSIRYSCNVCGRGFPPQGMRYRCCDGDDSMPCDFILHISCAKRPVDPLEEIRMQSISPLEVPRGNVLSLDMCITQ